MTERHDREVPRTGIGRKGSAPDSLNERRLLMCGTMLVAALTLILVFSIYLVSFPAEVDQHCCHICECDTDDACVPSDGLPTGSCIPSLSSDDDTAVSLNLAGIIPEA